MSKASELAKAYSVLCGSLSVGRVDLSVHPSGDLELTVTDIGGRSRLSPDLALKLMHWLADKFEDGDKPAKSLHPLGVGQQAAKPGKKAGESC